MELTEISGNVRLYFKDFTFGLPVCSEAMHVALLDAETEPGFNNTYRQYSKLIDTALKLHKDEIPFDLYFSLTGNMLSDAPCDEPRSLYYCRVQGWNNRLAIELLLPGNKELIRQECSSTEVASEKAIRFAFGGFVFSCLDFKISEVNMNIPYVSEALELYCLADDKQFLLNELFECDYVYLPIRKNTKKE